MAGDLIILGGKQLLNTIISKPSYLLAQLKSLKGGQGSGGDFVEVYQSDSVTPYIHAMMNPVHKFMQQQSSVHPARVRKT